MNFESGLNIIASGTPKHNIFFIKVEPLEDEVYQGIKEGKIFEGRIKKKNEALAEALREAGVSNDEIRRYRDILKNRQSSSCRFFIDFFVSSCYTPQTNYLIIK